MMSSHEAWSSIYTRVYFGYTRMYRWLVSSTLLELLQRLQSVQNAAARLVSGAKRLDHITPVLRQLHWLPTCGVQGGGLDVQGCPRASTVVPGR